MRSQSDIPNQSQASLQQSRTAPPVGRVLRIVLGLVLMVYVAPVYFQVPGRVAMESLLLLLGLIGVYSLIHIVVSRRIVAFGSCLGASSRLGCSLRFMLPVPRCYRSLAMARVSWQQSPSSVFHWWLLACAPFPVARRWRSLLSFLGSIPNWRVSSSLPLIDLSASCGANTVSNQH